MPKPALWDRGTAAVEWWADQWQEGHIQKKKN
jgi:hypothetical protein